MSDEVISQTANTGLLLSLIAVVAVTFSLLPGIPQPQSYHFLGTPNFDDVVSNVPFGVIGICGLLFCYVQVRAVPMPTPRIWKLKMVARPARSFLCPAYVRTNRTDHGDDGLRTECSNLLSEASLSSTAGLPAGILGHAIHGFTAKINQITAEGTKGIEKFGILQRWKSPKKCLFDSAVEP